MSFTSVKAERNKAKARVGIIGPSGSGKTYTSLRVATGLAGPSGKIFVIDTEGKRSTYYANEFDFNVIHFDPPFTPERYIEAVQYAEEQGADIIIIDSATHEWKGRGGILEINTNMGGNSFANWKELTPRHQRFIDAIIYSTVHVLVCIRGKDEYVVETDEKGKAAPKKVGKGADQRAGLEYELTVSFLLDQKTHIAEVMKDNTHLFENRNEVLTEEDGEKLREWSEEGKIPEHIKLQKEFGKLLENNIIKNHKNYDGFKKRLRLTDCDRLKKGIKLLSEIIAESKSKKKKEIDMPEDFEDDDPELDEMAQAGFDATEGNQPEIF